MIGAPRELSPNDSKIKGIVENTLPSVLKAIRQVRGEETHLVSYKIDQATYQIVSGKIYTIVLDCSISKCPENSDNNCVEDENLSKNLKCKLLTMYKPWLSSSPIYTEVSC